MAMAPGLKRKGGLFGSSPMRGPFDTPGIGDGMAAAQQPMAPAKPKFFGEGGVGRGIAGNIGDFLLQYSGMDPIYAPAMKQKQAMAYDQQKRQATRRERLEDWQAQEDYKRANPGPSAPFDDNAGNRWTIGPDGKPQLLFRDPNLKHTQQVVTDPDGSQRLVSIPIPNNVNPDGTFAAAPAFGGAPTAPAAPIGKLKPYGGQTATPSGNFR